ncbi:MAG: hypothetical protein PHI59_03155 [Candidatus Omnitrophica bacterium]|nr:hypothetical protein [Candidatus Omnitrophota bacterium]
MAHNVKREADNRRKYLRLNTIFPVEFQVVGKERREPLSEMREGFTQNIGKGGMGIFVKTLKERDKETFNFVPHETKVKLIINVPLDSEPIESFATVEWAEKEPGPILDTYFFGVSYDLINEIEYEKIVNYTKWLCLKPRLIFLAIVTLAVALLFSFGLLFEINNRKMHKEKELLISITKSKLTETERDKSEKSRLEAEAVLEDVKNKQAMMEEALKKIETEKTALEKVAKLSEEDRGQLQAALDEMTEEKTSLENKIEESAQGTPAPTEPVPSETSAAGTIPAERLKSEESNYRKFRELILDDKIHPLSAYLSSHRGSIYHAAALFALAEMRYKQGDTSLSEANYGQIVELYPESKYALYSSHRLEQLRQNYNYLRYSLQELCAKYRLPELFDYRNIEPYYRP